MERKKILVLAEAANPEWVSVPLVGWSIAAALRSIADVHLVTQVRNKPAILRAGWKEGEDFTAIDSEAVARPIHLFASAIGLNKGKAWTALQALVSLISYPYFERCVWKELGDRIKTGEFDIVHRVTPVSPTAASAIAAKCKAAGIPFIVGPLNGGVPWPKGFENERIREREFLSYVRSAYKLLPSRNKMLFSSTAIITGSRHTQSEVPKKFHAKTTRIPENAVDPIKFKPSNINRAELPLRGCFVGRLVPYKGADILLRGAASHLKVGKLHLDIVGDGPMKQELEQMAEKLGISDKVVFHGWLPHEEVSEVLKNAHLLTFPSVREFGGGVVLEAMALGVVPLICDYAGPAELVDDTTGFKLHMGTKAEITSRLERKIREILTDPKQLDAKSSAAIEKVLAKFTWIRKAEQISEIYDWVLSGKSGPIPKPFS